MPPSYYLTCAQFARRVRVSSARVRQWLADDRLPGATKHGRDWLIPSTCKRPEKIIPSRA